MRKAAEGDAVGDGSRATPAISVHPIFSVRAGKTLLLLSLVAAGAGFVFYCTVEALDQPIRALGGLKLSQVWAVARMSLWGGLAALFLAGPLWAGRIASACRQIGRAAWALALFAAAAWFLATLLKPLTQPDFTQAWQQLSELALAAAMALGAFAFDFRASPWVRRHRSALLNAMALGLGLLLAAAFAEIVARLVIRPPVFPPMFVESPLPGVNFMMQPGFDKVHPNVRVRLNSEGLRSPEIARPKTRKRILMLGDSCTFGAWVEQDKTYPAVLQTLLPADRYEVINAGVPAYGLDQMLAYLKHKGLEYQPDIVTYMFVYDDVTDALLADGRGYLKRDPAGDYGDLDARPDRYRWLPVPNWLLYRSYLLRGIHTRYYAIRDGRHHRGDRDLLGGLLAERWEWLQERLVAVRDAVQQAGGRFLFIVFPLGLSQKSIEALVEMAHRNEIEVLNLRSVLGDAKTYAAKYMNAFDSHPNAAAHAEIARAICEGLVARGYVEKTGDGRDRSAK